MNPFVSTSQPCPRGAHSSTRFTLVESRASGHHARYLVDFVRAVRRLDPNASLHLWLSPESRSEISELCPGGLPGVTTTAVDVWRPRRDWRGVLSGLAEFGHLRRALHNTDDEQVVALYGNRVALISSALLPRRLRRRVAFVLHQGAPAKQHRTRYAAVRLWALAYAARYSGSAIACVDPALASELASRGAQAFDLPLSLEAIGADAVPCFDSATSGEPRDQKGPLRLLCFGALSDRKGIRPLLAALDQVPDGLVDLTLLGQVHEGRSSRGSSLRETILQAQAHDPSAVHFRDGRYSDDELIRAIANSDVVYAANTGEEGDSAIFWWAMAAGKPVLVNRVSRGTAAMVSAHQLGLAVDLNPPDIASSLVRMRRDLTAVKARMVSERGPLVESRSRAATDRAVGHFLGIVHGSK